MCKPRPFASRNSQSRGNETMTEDDYQARRDEALRGAAVQGFVEEPIIKEILNGILHSCQNQWLEEQKADEREALWQQVQGVKKFTDALREIINTGKMATITLETEKA